MKRWLSIVLILLGAALFINGSHMASQAAYGEGKISNMEEGGQRRPTLGPIRRNVRSQEMQTQQQRLSAAEEKISTIGVNANWMRGIGAALFAIGIATLLWNRKNKE